MLYNTSYLITLFFVGKIIENINSEKEELVPFVLANNAKSPPSCPCDGSCCSRSLQDHILLP